MPTTRSKDSRSGYFYTKANSVSNYINSFFSSQRTPKTSPERNLLADQVVATRANSSTVVAASSEVTVTTEFVAPYSKVGILDDVPLINRIFLRANKDAIAVKYELAMDANGNNKRHGDRQQTFNNLKETLPTLRLLLLDLLLQFDDSEDTGADLLMDLKEQGIDVYNPDKQVVVFHSDTPEEVYARLNKLKESGAMSSDEHYLVADKGKEKTEIKMLAEMSVGLIKTLARTQFIEYQDGRDSSLSAVFEIEDRLACSALAEKRMRSGSTTAPNSCLFISHDNNDELQLQDAELNTNYF